MKINFSSRHIFSLLLGLLALNSYCFSQTRSFDIWFSSAFKYEMIKNLDLQVELGHRRTDFYSDRLYGDLILKYKLSDYTKIGVGWRHAGEGNTFDLEELTDRFNIDLSGKLKQKDFGLNYRIRYQKKYSDWFTDEEGVIAKRTIRTRFLFDYKLNKDWVFDVGMESFLLVSRQEPMYISKLRFISGFEYRINKSEKIALHYIRQQEVQVANPRTSHVIALDYTLDVKKMFKKMKKRKKKRDSK